MRASALTDNGELLPANVGDTERTVSLIAGGALLGVSLLRGKPWAAPLILGGGRAARSWLVGVLPREAVPRPRLLAPQRWVYDHERGKPADRCRRRSGRGIVPRQ